MANVRSVGYDFRAEMIGRKLDRDCVIVHQSLPEDRIEIDSLRRLLALEKNKTDKLLQRLVEYENRLLDSARREIELSREVARWAAENDQLRRNLASAKYVQPTPTRMPDPDFRMIFVED